MRINLGCGKRKMPGWINLDGQESVKPEILRHLEDGLPFADNSVEVVNARAVIEHVRKDKLIFVMKEVFRVLKPGGLFYIMVPHWAQKWMWSDPTHHTGWSREMMDWFIGENKPSEIGIDFKFKVAHYEPLYFPEARNIAEGWGIPLPEAGRHLVNIIDAHIWWLRKPGDDGPDWVQVNQEIRDLRVYPNGYNLDPNLLGYTAVEKVGPGAIDPSLTFTVADQGPEAVVPLTKLSQLNEPEPIKVKKKQLNKLLWFINVAWVGGTAYWALDAIKAMPDWDHVVCYLNGEENPFVTQQFLDAGVDFSKAGHGITKDLVHSIDPAAIILSNSSPKAIEGNHPWGWLAAEYPVFYVHHSAVTPWLPGVDADIFVSKYLMRQYGNLLARMKKAVVVPSGISITPYKAITRPHNDAPVLGSLASDSKLKFTDSKFDIFKEVVRINNSWRGEIVGGTKYYPGKQAQRVALLPFVDDPIPCYIRWSVFLNHGNVDDTWGRVVAEAMASGLPVVSDDRGAIPELVEHGVSGYLSNDVKEIIKYCKELMSDPVKRQAMGQAARERIFSICDGNPFKKQVEPLITKAIIRG